MTWKLQGPSTIITGDETLAVFREGTSIGEKVVYVGGKPVKRDTMEFQMTCNVQPLSGRDLLLVEELDRTKEQYWVFSNNQQIPLQVNDRVVRKDLQTNNSRISYQVQSVENWGSYQKSRIMRIDTGPYASPDQSN